MSVSVIKQKPNTYLTSVENSVSKFIFTTPIYSSGTVYKVLFIPLQYIIIFIFLICVGIIIIVYKNFPEEGKMLSVYFLWGALSFIYTLATHTLFSAGDIGRYRYTINIIPYSIIFITLWMIDKLKKRNAA